MIKKFSLIVLTLLFISCALIPVDPGAYPPDESMAAT